MRYRDSTHPASRGGMIPLRDGLTARLAAKSKDPRQIMLNQLWRNWHMVVGPDLAPLALPLGHRGNILLVGGENSLVLQELTYAAPEILERANAFMDENFFAKVELHAMLGKNPVGAMRPTVVPPRLRPARPEKLGNLHFDPDSLVGQCYAAYLRCFPT